MQLELDPLVITISEIEFKIPFYFYTSDFSMKNDEGDVETRCYLLFKENKSLADDSFTLGLPFV
jgi:hypothetical protein